MKKFLSTFTAVAVVALAVQVVGAFIVGLLSSARDYSTLDLDLGSGNLLSRVGDGLWAAVYILVLGIVGFALRYFVYRRLDAAGVNNRLLWVGIVVFEAVYALLNLAIIWAAFSPETDAGFAMIGAVELAVVATLLSIAAYVTTVIVSRRRTAVPVSN